MTLTQRMDGEPGASYLELIDLLQSQGASTREDSRELFRRVVFSTGSTGCRRLKPKKSSLGQPG